MGYIQKAAEIIREAQELAKTTSRVQYIYDLAGCLFISEKYDKSWVGHIYPGGRTETKGSLGVAIQDYLEKHEVKNEKQTD